MSNSLAITVTEKNTAKIEAAIAEVEGRAVVRLASYATVVRAVAAAEQRLALLPKRMWDGVTCTYDDATVPNSYGPGGESTAVAVRRQGSRWVFTGAKRVPARKASYGCRSEASFAQVTLGEAVSAAELLSMLLSKAGLTMAAGTRDQLGTDI